MPVNDNTIRVYRDTIQLQHEQAIVRMKPMINEMLYLNLPGSVTLEEMETLSCDIMSQILDVWDRALVTRHHTIDKE